MDIAKIQDTARALLALELEREAWTLPTKKAERLEALDARYDDLVAKLVTQAQQYTGSRAPVEQPQSAATDTAPTAAVPAAAPAAPASVAPAGDLVDEFDEPLF